MAGPTNDGGLFRRITIRHKQHSVNLTGAYPAQVSTASTTEKPFPEVSRFQVDRQLSTPHCWSLLGQNNGKAYTSEGNPKANNSLFYGVLSGFPGAKNNEYQVILLRGVPTIHKMHPQMKSPPSRLLRIPPHRMDYSPNVGWALSLVLCVIASPERYALPKEDEHNA